MTAYIFHRSLRLDDNLGLIEALKNTSKDVLPIFCVDPRQADPKRNKYFSPFCFGFMYQALQDLQHQLRAQGSDLILLHGEPHKILPIILKKKNVNTIFINRDYTPFARKRVAELEKALPDIVIEEVDDHLLYPIGSILSKSNTAYKVYTSFLNASKKLSVPKPNTVSKQLLSRLARKNTLPPSSATAWKALQLPSKFSPHYVPGGRTEALRRLRALPKTQQRYATCRNYLRYNTTHLSAFIKFGCISIREAWYGFGKVKRDSRIALQRELIWREFYYHYYNSYPNELEWSKSYPQAKIPSNSPDLIKKCFHELDKTGYLSNRGRMILANYILKDQKKYWKEGDRMFAKRLVDYDPIVNVGNWRWIEKQPSFRALKVSAQEKWDREC